MDASFVMLSPGQRPFGRSDELADQVGWIDQHVYIEQERHTGIAARFAGSGLPCEFQDNLAHALVLVVRISHPLKRCIKLHASYLNQIVAPIPDSGANN